MANDIFGPEDPAVKNGVFKEWKPSYEPFLPVTTTLADLAALGRRIWGPKPVGADATSQLPPVVVRLMVTVGDLARLARQYGSIHWEVNHGETDARVMARDELKKELGNVILSTIRWCDDLGLDVHDCVARAAVAQELFVKNERPR